MKEHYGEILSHKRNAKKEITKRYFLTCLSFCVLITRLL